MIRSIYKLMFFDKPLSVLSLLIILTVLSAVITSVYTGDLEKQNRALGSQISELRSLSYGLTGIKRTVELRERKIGLTRTGGIVPVMERILGSLDMKARAIKPLEKSRANEYVEEDAELEIQSADLNSLVNLLYKIENSPLPLKIKNSEIKTAFEDPNKFIMRLTVSLLSKE